MEIGLNVTESTDKDSLIQFVDQKSFPCIMAKAVAKTGLMQVHSVEEIESERVMSEVESRLHSFIDEFRSHPKRLSSFILVLKEEKYRKFEEFEKVFWKFLKRLNARDKRRFAPDPRVGEDPEADNFSFSIKSEAFFILLLHPCSPRWSRRFHYPTIVFNPHVQFENLRRRGVFHKIRSLIRKKDEELQGRINPMLNDFGEKSEVFQYVGRVYSSFEPNPLLN